MSLVTILLSTYNGEKFLPVLIESIQNQTFSDWALWIRDDGSKDQTLVLIQAALKKDHRIHLLQDTQGNLGALQSFASLINSAQQKLTRGYIFLCDQDDQWFPNKIANTLSTMQATEHQHGTTSPTLVHTDLVVTDETLQVLSPSFWQYQNINPKFTAFNRLLMQNVVTGCTTMINFPLLQLIKSIPKQAIMHDGWIALIASTQGQIIHLPEATLYYRQHGANDTGAKKWSWTFIIKRFYQGNKIRAGFLQKQEQAKAFLKLYHSQLSPSQLRTLSALATLQSQSPLRKRFELIKYHLFPQGFTRNLATWLYI